MLCALTARAEPKKLAVVEGCSGIRSLMTLVTLAVIYAYFTTPKSPDSKRLTIARSVILVLSAVPIAILTNALRVSGTGVLAHYYGTRVADGFFHSFSGWVVYIAAALLLFATGWGMDRVSRFRIHKFKSLRALRVSVVESSAAQTSSPRRHG